MLRVRELYDGVRIVAKLPQKDTICSVRSTIKPRLYVSVAGKLCLFGRAGFREEPPWPQMAMHASVDLYIIKSGSYHGSGACLDLSNPDPKFALGLVYFTQKAKSFQDSPSHRIL